MRSNCKKNTASKRASGRPAARNATTAKRKTTASSNGNGSVGRRRPTPATASQAMGKGGHGTLLEKLFTDLLKDIYWAEQHLVTHLEEMQQNATTEQLQDAFEDHLLVTKKHVSRLEKVFRLIGEEAEAKKCDAMEGLTKEAAGIMGETEDGTMTRDAALIIAAQKIEHYEIASYGSLVQIARTLGHDKAADLLETTLWEEEDTDCLLTEIAETYVNPLADSEEEEEEEDTEEESTDEEETA